MFSGTVNIIKRGKRLHCGIRARIAGDIKLVSACNTTWNIDDETYKANTQEVTCKSCLKILAKADENGRVNLGRDAIKRCRAQKVEAIE